MAGVVVAATDADEKVHGSRLAAFTMAALALPGMSVAEGIDLQPTAYGVDSAYSNYQESNGRMSIQAFQNSGDIKWSDDVSFRVNSTLDFIGGGSNPMDQSLVGGASPVFYWGKGNSYGKQQGELEYSQATHGPYKGQKGGIFDQRVAVDARVNLKLDDVNLGVGGGNSSEWDYISNFFNIDARWDINDKMTTLTAGFGYAADTVWADGGDQGAIHQQYTNGQYIGGDKNTYQGILGVTQILDKNSLVQVNLTVSNSSGFLSDPYKSVWVNNIPDPGGVNNFCTQSSHFAWQTNLCADHRPVSKTQSAVLVRYTRNFSELNSAALHFDYRFYSDTWDINSHTFEASWYQPLGFDIMLVPHVRYYSQGASFFYQTVYENPTADGFYSSDYRQAAFGAIGGGFRLSKKIIQNMELGGGVEYYDRTQGMGFISGAGSSVDNYNYTLYSFTLNLKI